MNKQSDQNTYKIKSVSISTELLNLVNKFAKKENRSFSNAVEILLSKSLKNAKITNN